MRAAGPDTDMAAVPARHYLDHLRQDSQVFVVLPGGFGTMNELFEALTLVATGKITMFPIVLVASDYWAPLLDFLKHTMLDRGYISASELALLRVADDPEDVVKIIRKPTRTSSSNRRPARQTVTTYQTVTA
jgi:uncharacterized protein (TIGR00730 family)